MHAGKGTEMSMQFSFNDGRAPGDGPGSGGAGRPEDARPFRILVIADFSGRASRAVVEPLAGRKPVRVDLDRLDDLPGEFGTLVRLPARGGVEIPVKTIEDLHPDCIYDHAELFAALRDLRSKARDPASYKAVAEEVRSWSSIAAPPASQIESKPSVVATPESEFASMLSESIGRQPSKPAASIDALIKQIVAPHIVPDRDPAQSELIEVIERAVASEMRSILRDPDWRRTESAWRSLHELVTGLELDETLELFALDASNAELVAHGSELEHAIVTAPTQTAGGVPWALVLHLVRHTPDSLDALPELASLAHRSGAVLASGLAPQTVGIESPAAHTDPAEWGETAEALASLAESPAADAVCLACPGMLLRQPYGRASDEIDRFEFEELKGDPTDHDLLWASGALAVGLLLGNAFTTVGWQAEPVGGGTIDGLPVIPTENGESMHPCAQTWLSDRASAALQKRGVTPLLSVQHRGAVQIAGLRAINGHPLACRWG